MPVGSASPTSATPSVAPASAPTSFKLYYTPSFPTLAFGDPFTGGPTAPGDPDTREPVIWFGGYDERSIALHLGLDTMAVPPNQCGMVEASPEVETLRASTERYANCLLDSWRPFTSSQGIELVPIEVVHCAITPDAVACPPPGSEADFAGRAEDSAITLAPAVISENYSPEIVTLIAAHEVGHVLQNQFVLVPAEPALTIGVFEPVDSTRFIRRVELQAQCLGVASLAADESIDWQVEQLQFGSFDQGHWDLRTVTFWVEQGMLGQVGECHAIIAANDPVSYDPDAVGSIYIRILLKQLD